MPKELREWLGTSPLDDDVRDAIDFSNMSLGKTVSAVCIAIQVLLLVRTVGAAVLPHTQLGTDARAAQILLPLVASTANFVLLAINARRYLSEQRSHAAAEASLVLFAAIESAVGAWMAFSNYAAGNQVFPLIYMLVITTCFFAVRPPVAFCITAEAFLLFSIGTAFSGALPPIEFAAGATLTGMAVLLASVIRYNATRLGAVREVESKTRALTDVLTGLKNRSSLLESLAERHEGEAVVAMCDIDDFKFFNDSFGHDFGDDLLRAFSSSLSHAFGSDNVYRQGGDEFLVLVWDTSPEGFLAMADYFKKSLRFIESLRGKAALTSSIGYAFGNVTSEDDVFSMISLADEKLLESKAVGKNATTGSEFQPGEWHGSHNAETRGGSPRVDQLTGLASMLEFRRRASIILEDGKAVEEGVEVVFLNLENFKAYNARYGLEAGDELLVGVADAIKESFPGQLASRFAEDHYFLVVRNCDTERAIDHVRAKAFVLRRDVNVLLKAGIYKIEDSKTSIGTACDKAKVACDSIRGQFDASWRRYDERLESEETLSRHILDNFDAALEKGHIEVYLQPVIRTITQRVCGFEVLARWNDPKMGMISPAVFVEVLERGHIIHQLDAYMLDCACDKWMREMEGQPSSKYIPFSINLSRLDFQLCDIFSLVDGIVSTHGIPHDVVHIEITESTLVESPRLLRGTIDKFRMAGYEVWMDDFGSGYSSLNTLKDFAFDVVKIDMVFLREFSSNPRSRQIISSIVDLAKRMGTHTLIEGVETGEQLEFLKSIGCEMIQGYYFGRPEPADVYLNMLRHSALPDENYDERGYYNQIGRANPLSPTPLLEMAESNADDAPLAIMELRAGRVSFLSMSQGYRSIIGMAGFHNEHHVADGISDRVDAQASRFMDLILAAARTGQEMSMDLVERGSTRLVRVRRIAKGPDDTYAFLLLMAQGLGEQQESSETIDQALKSLLPAYDRIDLIDLKTYTMTNVFHGTASHDMHFPERDPKNRVRLGEFAEFASEHVHPRDAERYLEFADLSTLRARMDARGRSFVTEAFRMRNPDGSYSWKTVFLGLAAISGRDTAIIGMRDVNESVINRVSGDMGITDHDLFQTLISALPFGVFWKDENRRFVGANQYFKDYYGFSDDRSFVGKTDEEMGWHIDPERFMRDEERVLADGAEVNDEHGSCIAGGRRRDIVVTKRRIVHDGETLGLAGFFVDATARDAISRSFEDLSIVDIHTGLLNGKGLDESAAAYEDIYRRRGVDFAHMELVVRGLEAIESTYGRELADRLVARVADAARQTIGVRGICARTFGGSFSLMWQLKQREDPRDVVEQVKAAVNQITSVDGKRVNPTFSTGAAIFSETEDLEGLRSLAQSRMG